MPASILLKFFVHRNLDHHIQLHFKILIPSHWLHVRASEWSKFCYEHFSKNIEGSKIKNIVRYSEYNTKTCNIQIIGYNPQIGEPLIGQISKFQSFVLPTFAAGFGNLWKVLEGGSSKFRLVVCTCTSLACLFGERLLSPLLGGEGVGVH